MKSFRRIPIVICLVTLVNSLMAQTAPSLRNSSFWQAGNSYRMATATEASGNAVSVGSAGANRTWNLSSLVLDSEYEENLIAKAGTAFAANFPNANLATDDGDGCFSYYKVAPNGVFFQGYRCDANNYMTTTGDGLPELALGLSFNQTSTGSSTITNRDDFNLVPQTQTISYSITYDAWGSLTLPGNRVFSQVARQEISYTDGTDTDFYYVFVNTVNGELIAWYDDTFEEWEYSITADPGATSRPEPWTHAPARVYPNPVQDVLTVEVPGLGNSQIVELAMINLMGQMLVCESQPAADVLHLPVTELATGLYHLRIRTGNQETFVKVVKQ
jgi:hypothetical protein